LLLFTLLRLLPSTRCTLLRILPFIYPRYTQVMQIQLLDPASLVLIGKLPFVRNKRAFGESRLIAPHCLASLCHVLLFAPDRKHLTSGFHVRQPYVKMTTVVAISIPNLSYYSVPACFTPHRPPLAEALRFPCRPRVTCGPYYCCSRCFQQKLQFNG